MIKKLVVLTTIILLFSALYAGSNTNHNLDPYNPEYVKGEILVKFKDDVELQISSDRGILETGINSLNELTSKWQVYEMKKVFKTAEKRTEPKFIKTYKGETIEVPQLFNIYKMKIPDETDIEEAIEEFEQDPNVEYAEPNYYFYTMDTYPDDPYYTGGSQWYIDFVNAPAAWDSTTGDTTQTIGIIDTGVDWDHPDLINKIWNNSNEIPNNGIDDDGNGFIDDIRGWDFVNDDNNPNDDNSHGTHVAGIAAAETNNGVGIAGIAWNAKIMPVKMLQSSGAGSSSDLAAAIDYAANNGAEVINMSLGSYGESMTVKITLENAYAYAVLVAAAGNNGFKIDPPFPPWPLYAPMYPACYSFVIGVEASTQAGVRAGFSNFDPSGPIVAANSYGHNYEIKAPGVGIYSTFPNGNYNSLSGTSMASPIVAGAVALMKSYNPTQSTEQLFARLIQGANNCILDIANSLDYELVPDLHYVEYTLVDTLPGCDDDGIADAGETIEIYLTIKNGGGWADSVWTKLRFGEFEDTTTAIILDSTSFLGDISAYATLTGELDPFRIEIDPDVVNNRDIVFEYEIGANNFSQFTGELIITVQNGIEFSGLYENLVHLTPDKYYIIAGNVVFDSLIIDPGTIIRLNEGAGLLISSHLDVTGTPDSMITFTNYGEGNWEQIKNVSNNPMVMKYCIIEYSTGDYYGSIKEIDLNNCILKYNSSSFTRSQYTNIQQCLFVNNSANSLIYSHRGGLIEKNIFVNNETSQPAVTIWQAFMSINALRNNIFINNIQPTFNSAYSFSTAFPVWSINKLSPNYWGTIDSTNIESMILDFFEDPDYPVLCGSDSALVAPPAECHGVVWKVEINNILVNKYDNPYNSPTGLGIVGCENLKFDVYFNRAMDPNYEPFLTFGVQEPFTQHIVQDSTLWSADSTIWTAYYDIGLETGDGINTIRVANAKDTDHFEIPIEDTRFQFVIQAAGAASIDFIATAGIGKVDMEWPIAETSDVLGYNMYRYENITDSTFSDITLINTELIIDSTYTDFAVIPDTTYHYLYKIVGTDMQESDFSKVVSATPFSAANGDANGDLTVNVLDITTIVAYMLGQDPEPFLFDAADVNYDGSINVLDIIGVINIILPGKNQIVSKESPVEIRLKDKWIVLKSEGNVAGLQFKLYGDNLQDVILSSELEGFEFSYKINEDHIIGIVYNFQGKTIPEGIKQIIRLETNDELTIEDVVAGNRAGNSLLVNINHDTQITPDKFFVRQNYPNPFKNNTTIKYALAKKSEVKLTIYNIKGQRVRTFDRGEQESGFYNVVWDGKDDNGRIVGNGIYLFKIKADINDGGTFSKVRKILLIK